jgi:hypothetical protein
LHAAEVTGQEVVSDVIASFDQFIGTAQPNRDANTINVQHDPAP